MSIVITPITYLHCPLCRVFCGTIIIIKLLASESFDTLETSVKRSSKRLTTCDGVVAAAVSVKCKDKLR